MKLPKNRESGQALIMALILLALGSLLVVPLLGQTFTNLGYHQSIECKTVNSYTADSGVQYALTKLYNRPGGYTDEDLQENFTLNGRSVDVTAEYVGGGIYKVTSVASGGGCGSTRITTYINLGAGAFAFVIAASETMTLENTMVDSFPAPGGKANIHSNGVILLVGSEVNGDASAVYTITISGDSLVTGTVTYPSAEVTFPGDYSELYKTMALEGDDSPHDGDLPISANQSLGPLYIDGDLLITGSPTNVINITLEGTVYVTGILKVEHAHLDGEENICVEGSVSIEGGGYGSEIIPLITTTSGNITLEAGWVVDAVLYAPNGSVNFENVHLYGAVGGKTVYIESSNVTYAEELQGRQDLPGGALHTIAYSYS